MNKHERIAADEAPSQHQIWAALGWSTDHIIAARARVQDDYDAMTKAVAALADATRANRMVDMKLAAEHVQKAAETYKASAVFHGSYIATEAAVLARKAVEHLNRRARS